jgi:hypothetical protein
VTERIRRCAGGAIRQTRAALRPAITDAMLSLAAVLIGLTGTGFLLAAAFGALSRSLGPELSALILGMSLATASALVLMLVQLRRGARADALRRAEDAAAKEPGLQGAGATAAFAAAFVLGRRLASRVRD